MAVDVSVQINRPAENVFGLLADPGNDPQWHVDVTQPRLESGTAGEAGATYR